MHMTTTCAAWRAFIQERKMASLKLCPFYIEPSSSIPIFPRPMAYWLGATACALRTAGCLSKKRRSRKHCGLPERRSS